MTTILSGIVHTVFPIEQYGNFTKQRFWLKQVNVKYPQIWEIEFHHDDVDSIKRKGVDDNKTIIDCEIEVRGRLWSKGGREGVMNQLICKSLKIKK